jgi:tetratricopeptide (TPR) repeat protein
MLETRPPRRHWSNRSAVWYELKEYQHALQDGEMCIRLKADWPKGYFRAGKALMALENYIDAATVLYEGAKHETRGESTLADLFQRAVALGRRQHKAQQQSQ